MKDPEPELKEGAGKGAYPQKVLSVYDIVVITIGVVVGAGIFGLPGLVALFTQDPVLYLGLWVVGAAVVLVGALTYTELGSTFPSAGGEYTFLREAYGELFSFLFNWARTSIIQTASIVIMAYLLARYLQEIVNLGQFGESIYAAITVLIMVGVNLAGIRQSTSFQKLVQSILVLGLVMVGLLLLVGPGNPQPMDPQASLPPVDWMLALVFVLYVYGGWNEAAYITAESRTGPKGILRGFMVSVAVLAGLYLLINFGLLQSLGLGGLIGNNTPIAAGLSNVFGESGVFIATTLLAIAALTTINVTIFTGARAVYALGNNLPKLKNFGLWQAQRDNPFNAILLIGAVALVWIGAVAITGVDGFEQMIDVTLPIFWFFILMTGISLFVLRAKQPNIERPFKVPLYPVVPLLFCATCGFMLWRSTDYALTRTDFGKWGLVVVALGIPLYFLFRGNSTKSDIDLSLKE
ncbi:MAG: APC family permease [Fimbriimonadaceae bacterium]